MKTDSWLENDISNLVNFNASSQKSESLHFDGLLLSKAYKYLDEKVQKSYINFKKFQIFLFLDKTVSEN